MDKLIGKPIGHNLYVLQQIIPRKKLIKTAKQYKKLNLKPSTSLDFILGFFAVGIFYGWLDHTDYKTAIDQLFAHLDLIEITKREQWMMELLDA